MTRTYTLKSNLRWGGKLHRPGADIDAKEGSDLLATLERMEKRGDAEHIGGAAPVKKKSKKPGGGGEKSASSNPDPGPAATEPLTREGALKLAMRELGPDDFTSKGLPDVNRVVVAATKHLGETVTLKAEERDALWAEVQKELSGS